MGRFLSPDDLRFIAEARDVDHLSQLEAEALILGVHHGELGGLIAQHWDLPPRVVQGIIYHHNPTEGHDVVCDFTYLANEVAKQIEAGIEEGRGDFAISSEVTARLLTSPAQLDTLCTIATGRFAEVSLRYNAV